MRSWLKYLFCRHRRFIWRGRIGDHDYGNCLDCGYFVERTAESESEQ